MRKKKGSGKKPVLEKVLLATAILNLLKALLDFIRELLD